MTPSGGPAAINGFLYQIVHHLRWLANVSLTGELDGQRIKHALLVLEPQCGGDARVESRGIYIVEQYKTRQANTWSLSDIESVLRNLKQAVPDVPPQCAQYRFVTNGRPGRLGSFRDFLADIRGAEDLNEIDNVRTKKFKNGFTATNLEYFEHLVVSTRSSTHLDIVNDRVVTFHLLKHFEMAFCDRSEDRTAELESLLRPYVSDLGEERNIRLQLEATIFNELSKGEKRFTPEDITTMLQTVGLNTDRLKNLWELPETMGRQTLRHLSHLKYQAELDVRSEPRWQDYKPVLIIAGESGVGKTWQLARLLDVRSREGFIVSVVLNARSREDFLTQTSRNIWQLGLGETSEKSLFAVSRFLSELEREVSFPGVIVALDNVQNVELARDLVRQDWAKLEMRLVLTVSDAVAQALSLTDNESICTHRIGDFSVPELDSLFTKSGKRWVDLPSDLKKLLRKPILAGLYLELPYSSVQRAPRSEYEIFDRFWLRIRINGRHGDEGIAMALAERVCKGKSYPLDRVQWPEIGLTEESPLLRLETAGWFSKTENGEIAFCHNRLLNWAVAKCLVRELQQGRLEVHNLANFISNECEELDNGKSSQLGYVAMDVVWLLADGQNNQRTSVKLLTILDESGRFGPYGEILYVDLVPTLGQRAVDSLHSRLIELDVSSEREYRVGLVAKSFSRLAQQENVNLTDAVSTLLIARSKDLQDVALAVLTVAPRTEYLDRLWMVHRRRLSELATDSSLYRQDYCEASFVALREATRLSPGWLREQILAAEPQEETLSELVYLLHALEHPCAREIWKETKSLLFDSVSVEKARSLLYCIERFRDIEKLDFVIKQLSHPNDFASSAALIALAVLDPNQAISRLPEVEESQRYLFRNQWLPVLMHTAPELTRQWFHKSANPDLKGCQLIVELFWERPDQLDRELLEKILRGVENELSERLDDVQAGNSVWLFHILNFLARIVHPDLHAMLELEAGSEFERLLTVAACGRLQGISMSSDTILENARRVLIFIGGMGISTLIENELNSEHYWVRHRGLKWAVVCADRKIVDSIATLASRSKSKDGIADVDSELVHEFYEATRVLAVLGADECLVQVLRNTGSTEVAVELAELRAWRGGMPSDLIKNTLQVLSRENPPEGLLLTELTIARLSGDAGLIPKVRSVLGNADPTGQIARFACIALMDLGDSSQHFAELAGQLLRTEENSGWGLRSLIRMGRQGTDLLVSWLTERLLERRNDFEDFAIRALYHDRTTRNLSIQLAADICRSGNSSDYTPFDIAAEANDAVLRDQVLDKAFAEYSSDLSQQLRAIEGLARFSVHRAVEAALLGLRNYPKLARKLCELVVHIDPQNAPAKLFDAALETEQKDLVTIVGQALRQVDRKLVSHLLIDKMNSSLSVRRVAAEIAGWLPTPEIKKALVNLANRATNSGVRRTALEALEMHEKEANLRVLLGSFETATNQKRWSLLIAVLQVADPYLLSNPHDELWLGNVLSDTVPRKFKFHADSELEKLLNRT